MTPSSSAVSRHGRVGRSVAPRVLVTHSHGKGDDVARGGDESSSSRRARRGSEKAWGGALCVVRSHWPSETVYLASS